jgi:putative hydrolase of the HAD superfamily
VLVEAAVAAGIPENQLDVDTVMDHYNWGVVPGTSIFPDVLDGLESLRQCGIKMGLVTNAYQPMRLRDIEMDGHGILDFFPCCRFSAADVGYLKPHLSIFELALDCMGVEPEETVFVGDNPMADIGGAQAAGMRAVLRLVPHRIMQVGHPIVPDATINALTELPQLFSNWFPGWDQANGR